MCTEFTIFFHCVRPRILFAAAILLMSSHYSFGLTAFEANKCDDVSALSTELIGVVLFGEGSSSISEPMAKIGKAIGDVVAKRRSDPSIEVYLIGHADKVGSDRINQTLGKERAEAVGKLLTGVVAAPIEVVTCGEVRPLLETEDDRAHPHNRRVEVRLGK